MDSVYYKLVIYPVLSEVMLKLHRSSTALLISLHYLKSHFLELLSAIPYLNRY